MIAWLKRWRARRAVRRWDRYRASMTPEQREREDRNSLEILAAYEAPNVRKALLAVHAKHMAAGLAERR